MSDILANIDDTLADWNGSADSMRWGPDGNHEPEQFPLDLERLWQQIVDVRATPSQPQRPWRLDPAVWPHRDFILDLHRITLTPGMVILVDGVSELERLRVIEGPPYGPWRVRPVTGRPSKLDARYRQRQKNRRKRRH